MKTSFFIAAFCILFLSGFVVWSQLQRNSNDISIAVTNTNDDYSLTATYDPSQTGRVQDYINKSIAPNGLFKSDHDYFDVTTTLQDHTNFYIKASPGKLTIDIDKKKNSYSSYMRIKKMCEGVGNVLKGK
ncbi:hypothetical protein [Mucilaginibacter sp.]|uniref:hypothetical protein n=1 Tax=Mucilaginibacter sp. TaxID=1882438 RepID=UPI003D10830B